MSEHIEGIWYLPENPSNEMIGTLSYSYDSGITLKILGSFSPNLLVTYDNHEIINGFTVDGKKISLINCYKHNYKFHAPGIEESFYSAQYLMLGDSYKKIPGRIFSCFLVHLTGIEDWLDLQLYKITNDYALKYNKYEYSTPDEIIYKINDDLDVSIIHHTTYQAGPSTNRISHKSICYLKFTSKSCFEHQDIPLVIQKIRLLLTFFTLKPFYADEIKILSPEKRELHSGKFIDVWINFYYHQLSERHTKHTIEENKFSYLKYLMPYQKVKSSFASLIAGWYTNYDNLTPILGSFFSQFYLPENTIENKFLSIIQAIEGYHRRTRKNYSMPKQKFIEMKERILASVNHEDKKWLTKKLEYANEPSLRHRLLELFEESYSFGFQNILHNSKKLINKIVYTRNYYTHYEENLKPKILNTDELIKVTEKLVFLLLFLIFKQVGLTNEIIIEILASAKDFNIINVFDEISINDQISTKKNKDVIPPST